MADREVYGMELNPSGQDSTKPEKSTNEVNRGWLQKMISTSYNRQSRVTDLN